MAKSISDRVIALAALLQNTRLVDAIARQGVTDVQEVDTALHSLFAFDAPDSAAIYGGTVNLHSGLRLLERQLAQPQIDLPTRYAIAIIGLERRLQRQSATLEHLAQGLRQIDDEHAETHLLERIPSLSQLYLSTLTQLQPQIMVQGNPQHLQIEGNTQRIRAMLMAAVRAAVLWRQSGGSRFGLLWQRKALLETTRALLRAPLGH